MLHEAGDEKGRSLAKLFVVQAVQPRWQQTATGIHLSWPATQTLEPREMLEASGILGRIPPPF